MDEPTTLTDEEIRGDDPRAVMGDDDGTDTDTDDSDGADTDATDADADDTDA